MGSEDLPHSAVEQRPAGEHFLLLGEADLLRRNGRLPSRPPWYLEARPRKGWFEFVDVVADFPGGALAL
eukprot:scaffold1389_cov335-Pavlova_lutheri.AAC.1